MKFFIQFAFIFFVTKIQAQNCMALYSYGANSTNVNFFNQSVASNAHFYWNFGDGTSSNIVSPAHEYTDNGVYLVTLYVQDTLTNCSSHYDQWLTIIKSSSDPCVPLIYDSIYYDPTSYYKCLLKILDESTSCSAYHAVYNVGNASGPQNNIVGLGLWPGNYIATAYYFDSFNNYKRSALVTSPNNFDRAKNYNKCSANFEFSVTAEDSGSQTIRFSAMNKHASSYSWIVPTGLGNPILSSYDTVSITYPQPPYVNYPNFAMDAVLAIKESDGCRDSTRQFVIVKTKKSTIVGIKNESIQSIKANLYPNPVKDRLKVDLVLPNIKDVKFNIENAFGQKILEQNSSSLNSQLDLSQLSNGIYFLKIECSFGQSVYKIIKE